MKHIIGGALASKLRPDKKEEYFSLIKSCKPLLQTLKERKFPFSKEK
jgi:hypothetical protein